MRDIDVIKNFKNLYLKSVKINNDIYIGYQHIDNNLIQSFEIPISIALNILQKKLNKIKNYIKNILDLLNDNQKIAIISLVQDIGITDFLKSNIYKLILNNIEVKEQQFLKFIYNNKIKNSKKMKRRMIQYLIYTGKITNIQKIREIYNGSN